jgi:hypothetical protein
VAIGERVEIPKELQVDLILAQVKKLELTPESILLVKSDDIDYDIIQGLRDRLPHARAILGMRASDDISVITVKPEDTLVVCTEENFDPETREAIEATIRAKTGCRGVLFVGAEVDVDIEKVPSNG